MPDDYKVIVNTNHPIIVDLSSKLEKKTISKRIKFDEQLLTLNTEKSELEVKLKDFKTEDEKPVEDKTRLEELNGKISSVEEEKIDVYKEFGQKQKVVSQLFDLALLSNNLLKGESLNNFVTRSVDLLKKYEMKFSPRRK
jgi:molecular chaperone HtpG